MQPGTQHASLDEVLGPATERFFGSRYTTVAATLEPLTVMRAEGGGESAEGVARLDFDGLWSRKGDRAADPHVSTVDIIALAGQAAEQLTGAGSERPWEWSVRQMDIRAGKVPVESGFDALPVTSSIERSRAGATVTVSVANFTARVELVRSRELREGLPLLNGTVYSSLYRLRSPEVRDVQLSGDGENARAWCVVPGLAGSWAEAGVDRMRGSRLNLVDAFVVVLQLGQAMLYRRDALSRADSDTLWMRSARLRATGERATSADVTAMLQQPRIVTTGSDTWRLATIAGVVGGLFHVDCSVAHRVPAEEVAAREVASIAHHASPQRVRT